MDGLRGWAAIFVLLHHVSQQVGGAQAPQWHFKFFDRPFSFIPLFLDGRLSVFVFFALSGFVLSRPFFTSGSRLQVLDLALRRYPRLAIPIICYCIIVFVYSVTLAPSVADVASQHHLKPTYYLKSQPTFWDALAAGLYRVYLPYGPRTQFSAALWTMNPELLGSFLLFGILLICGRSRFFLISGLFAFAIYGHLNAIPIEAMALGALIAFAVSQPWHERIVAKCTTWRLLVSCGFIAALAAASGRPLRADQMLPYCGAALVYATAVSPWLQIALGSRLSLWFGKISFPLYLIHMLAIFLGTAPLALWGKDAPAVPFLMMVGGALLLARLFLPIEDLAVKGSRAVSKWMLAGQTERNNRNAVGTDDVVHSRF